MLLVKQYAANMKQEFGELLRQRRNSRGLSQRALAEKLGELGFPIDPTAITRMESGQREPKLSEALTICDYLDIDLMTLDYGVHGLAYHGAVEQARFSYLDARKALRQYVNDAEYVYMIYRPDRNDPDDVAKSHDEVLEYTLAVLQNALDGETEKLPNARESHIDAEFRKRLLDEVVADLEAPNDAPAT